jgi:hypothetical protein
MVSHANYRDYIGKKVVVEIFCYAGGMMYPDDNTLIGMNEDYYYFRSAELDVNGNEIFWHFTSQSSKDQSISVWELEEYNEFQKQLTTNN